MKQLTVVYAVGTEVMTASFEEYKQGHENTTLIDILPTEASGSEYANQVRKHIEKMKNKDKLEFIKVGHLQQIKGAFIVAVELGGTEVTYYDEDNRLGGAWQHFGTFQTEERAALVVALIEGHIQAMGDEEDQSAYTTFEKFCKGEYADVYRDASVDLTAQMLSINEQRAEEAKIQHSLKVTIFTEKLGEFVAEEFFESKDELTKAKIQFGEGLQLLLREDGGSGQLTLMPQGQMMIFPYEILKNSIIIIE